MALGKEAINLCALHELPDGEARGFDPFQTGRDVLFVVRRGKKVTAFLNRCPHQGASLPYRKNAYLNAGRSRIVCSAHGALFDIDTGKCLKGAALGHSLDPVDVVITHEDKVVAHLDAQI
ncbi:MAG: Rieske (2Fe-2S) protein [Gammaproteobacteria bacterium]